MFEFADVGTRQVQAFGSFTKLYPSSRQPRKVEDAFGRRHWPSSFCSFSVCILAFGLVLRLLTFTQRISELKNLKQLNLAGTMVTDKVLASMRDLSLTSLDIGQTPLKPKGKWPTYLTSMTSLQSLRLDVVPMKTVNCDFLLAFPDLHTLVWFYILLWLNCLRIYRKPTAR